MLIWVPVKLQSENRVRSQHWSATFRANKRVRLAWKSSLASLSASERSLIATMLCQGEQRPCEMPSQRASDATTETSGCDGNTGNFRQAENKV